MLSARRAPFWLLYVLLVAVLLGLTYLVPHDRSFPVINTVNDPAAAILSTLGDMIKLIVALNTAMMAAAATVTVKGREWTTKWDRLDSVLIMLSFASGAVSYFGIYLTYMRILTMTAAKASTINPLEGGIVWSLRLQYCGTVAGIIFLGLVFARMLEGRRSGPAPARAKKTHDA